MPFHRLTALFLAATLLGAPILCAPGAARAEKSDTALIVIAVAEKDETDGIVEVSREEVKAAVHAASLSLKSGKRGRIWCVPFARAVSGIEIKGDAATWWKKAGDLYQRGQVPASGAVLTFRSTSKMPKGHVAVVSQVIDDRTILVDQANWVRNRITTDTLVVDVSPENDWSQVRVAYSGTALGRVSPTFGFIYPARRS